MHVEQQNRPSLVVHEWLAVITIIMTLALLTGLSIMSSKNSGGAVDGRQHYIKPQEIEVFIEGAVEYPGSHILKIGSTMEDLLRIAKPLPQANLKRLKPTSKLRNGQVISVQARTEGRK